MTTDLKSMTVDVLRDYVSACTDSKVVTTVFDELARRLEAVTLERNKNDNKIDALDDEVVTLQERLEEAQRKIVAQEADVRNILNRIPAIVNGEMIIDHYDIEGEFVGSESVDTLAVLGSVVGALEAMDYVALATHDAELTAKAKAEALEEVRKDYNGVAGAFQAWEIVKHLTDKAAEYRVKAKGE